MRIIILSLGPFFALIGVAAKLMLKAIAKLLIKFLKNLWAKKKWQKIFLHRIVEKGYWKTLPCAT